jgi:arylsulfatase
LNGIIGKADQMMNHIDDWGSPNTFPHYAVGWAHACNTPFQWTKQVASHFGGTRNGMVVHWPDGIKAKGEIRSQFTHVTDIAPTVLEAADLPFPKSVNGTEQIPFSGISFMFSFDDAKAAERHTTQYFEMFGNRGIYDKGWVACTRHSTPGFRKLFLSLKKIFGNYTMWKKIFQKPIILLPEPGKAERDAGNL